MKIRGVRYFFSEAFKNIFSNGWMTIASIFTVVASLLVLGVFLTLSINVSNMAGNLEDSYQIVVFVDEKVSDDGVKIIGSQLKNTENVADAVLTTREERLLILRDKMGENASKLDRYKDDNPLRDMYQVTLNDLSKSEQTIDKIEKINGIAKIQRNEEAIDKLVKAANYIKTFSLWIIVALAIVSIFIISNTIKLTVYTRRKEINIMKFIGATDWFIRWPFIIEGLLIGFISSLVSCAVLSYMYGAFMTSIGSYSELIGALPKEIAFFIAFLL
ncbi:MAG: permease-like cell division protein FtsX [Clostridia bacterium]|nr:permease-like cell division protein FtsX [Clostridia bacterium]